MQAGMLKPPFSLCAGCKMLAKRFERLKVTKVRVGGRGYFEQNGRESRTAGTQYQAAIAFCALKHTHISYKPAIPMDRGLSIDASSGVFEEGDLALVEEGGG